jgi:hypothetical protein
MPLSGIQVLYYQPDTLCLWGIPYDMHPSQSPRDLLQHPNRGWIWLGTPGWFGSMAPDRKEAVKAYIDNNREHVPTRPGEWSRLPVDS